MKNKFFGIVLSVIMVISILPYSLSTAFATQTEEYDVDRVSTVIEKINEIGEITIHSGNKIKEARNAYSELDETEQALVDNYSILTDAEDEILLLYEEVSNTDHRYVYDETMEYLSGLGTPVVGTEGGEWMVIDLTRSGYDCPDGYYENVVAYVKENINEKGQLHRVKSTDNSRVILALTSAGYDVTNVDGYNLLEGLSDISYLKRQGINGPVWALIALDSYNYEIPENENAEVQATREGIISYILEKQLDDGGWSIAGTNADPDMTAMAIQSLAPYYDADVTVQAAVDRALDCLSNSQNENASFGSYDGICSESCAQVIVALTALGIDPEADERFIKNGISVVDTLCIFAVDGGGFEHIPYSGLNGMATEQGQYALASYFRFLDGKTSLYDMTDVTIYTDDSSDDGYNDYWDDSYTDEWNEDYTDNLDDTYADEEDYTNDSEDSDDIASDDLTSTEEKADEENESENKLTFTKNTFCDIKENDWFYESVKYVFENELMQGTQNGFEPESKMTRAMLVTVLFRIESPENIEKTHSFADVNDGGWYSDAVNWAAENNIVRGVSESSFAPDEDITREQLALIIYRYAKMKGMDVSCDLSLEGFVDSDDISDWALDAIKWANSLELINGTSDTTLSPKDTATRAEVATILMRFCKMK